MVQTLNDEVQQSEVYFCQLIGPQQRDRKRTEPRICTRFLVVLFCIFFFLSGKDVTRCKTWIKLNPMRDRGSWVCCYVFAA